MGLRDEFEKETGITWAKYDEEDMHTEYWEIKE